MEQIRIFFVRNAANYFDGIGQNTYEFAYSKRRPHHQFVTGGLALNTDLLAKIEAHIPAVSELSRIYREGHEASARAAIINIVLASEARYLTREEVLYLAWLKSDYDKRVRDLDEGLKRQWLAKQGGQRVPGRRSVHVRRQRAA